MDRRLIVLLVGGALLAVAAVVFLAPTREPPAEPPAAPVADEPAVRNPIEPAAPAPGGAPAPPLPGLAESDPVAREELGGVVGSEAVTALVVESNLVRRFVATVDQLDREKLPVEGRVLRAPTGPFIVSGAEGDTTLSPQNYARYTPIVAVLQRADAATLASLYRRWYPLIQQAYVDLGYPQGYFNDRLVAIIDHLIEAPEVVEPVRLVQPSVYYQFADPAVEQLSAGRKLLVRMGPQNAAVVKAKLAELRGQVAAAP
jgi:hypothetical protein